MRIIFFLFIILSFIGCKSQTENNPDITPEAIEFHPKKFTKIDSLKTDQQVEDLINRLLSHEKRKFLVKKISDFDDGFLYVDYCKRTSDSLGIDKAFYKADFDGNQLTDLLVTGDYYDFTIFTVLNYGNDSLSLRQLTRNHFQACVFPKIKDDSIIEFYYFSQNGYQKENKLSKKLLTYKFNDFVELNENPVNHKIEKIEFETGPCFGSCPIFSLILTKGEKSSFEAIAYNFNDDWLHGGDNEGKFQTILKRENWEELTTILNYLDFENLENDYAVNWTDDQSAKLKIYHDEGKVKEIHDYGLIGTFGLSILYNKLFEIRKNQDWKKL